MVSNFIFFISEREWLAQELCLEYNKHRKGDLFLALADYVLADRRSLLDKVEAEVIGEDEDLNAPAETYGKDDQSLGDNPYPNPNLQYVVRRATRNVKRQDERTALAQLRKEIG